VCRGFESALRHATDSVPSDVPVTTLCVEGSPAARIIEQARENGHDLIVMGSHGRGRLGDALLGSVSREVVHRSPVPVLIVRRDTETQEAAEAIG
jgi:nucleotide-binding universal stress UspA family protein